jgi:hypothetical protein
MEEILGVLAQFVLEVIGQVFLELGFRGWPRSSRGARLAIRPSPSWGMPRKGWPPGA